MLARRQHRQEDNKAGQSSCRYQRSDSGCDLPLVQNKNQTILFEGVTPNFYHIKNHAWRDANIGIAGHQHRHQSYTLWNPIPEHKPMPT